MVLLWFVYDVRGIILCISKKNSKNCLQKTFKWDLPPRRNRYTEGVTYVSKMISINELPPTLIKIGEKLKYKDATWKLKDWKIIRCRKNKIMLRAPYICYPDALPMRCHIHFFLAFRGSTCSGNTISISFGTTRRLQDGWELELSEIYCLCVRRFILPRVYAYLPRFSTYLYMLEQNERFAWLHETWTQMLEEYNILK